MLKYLQGKESRRNGRERSDEEDGGWKEWG